MLFRLALKFNLILYTSVRSLPSCRIPGGRGLPAGAGPAAEAKEDPGMPHWKPRGPGPRNEVELRNLSKPPLGKSSAFPAHQDLQRLEATPPPERRHEASWAGLSCLPVGLANPQFTPGYLPAHLRQIK